RRLASSGRDRVLTVWRLPDQPTLDERSLVTPTEGLQSFSVAEPSESLPDVPVVSEQDVLAFFSAASEASAEALAPAERASGDDGGDDGGDDANTPAEEPPDSAPVDEPARGDDDAGVEPARNAIPDDGVPQVIERETNLTGAEGWQACI